MNTPVLDLKDRLRQREKSSRIKPEAKTAPVPDAFKEKPPLDSIKGARIWSGKI